MLEGILEGYSLVADTDMQTAEEVSPQASMNQTAVPPIPGPGFLLCYNQAKPN